MSSKDIIISANKISKSYQIYNDSKNRLKQFIFPKISNFFGITPKKYYEDFWALNDVTFNIKRGESTAILGRNGSGKSTLLQIICGTCLQSSGTLTINGRIAALLELGSGFNHEFTGKENVYMSASIAGLSRKDIDTRYEGIIEFADIGNYISQPIKTYSSGMVLRLAFAVIINIDADILVIDEALAVGDAIFTQKCLRFIAEFKRTGTVIFVSHDPAAIIEVADKAIWLTDGTIKDAGNVKNILEKYHQFNIAQITKETLDQEPGKSTNLKNYRKDTLDINFLNLKAKNNNTNTVNIVRAYILNANDEPTQIIKGNENIKLVFFMEIVKDINGLLIGFSIKDTLGKVVIEENNSQFGPPKTTANKNDLIKVTFDYYLPAFKAGEYFFDLAVAEGTQDNHINHIWIYEAITFTSIPTEDVYGQISTKISNFKLETIND